MAQRSRFVTPGDKLGKYEVIRQIAIGGMAELYLARTSGIEGFEKLVVIKRILPQFCSSSSFVNMFLTEARIAATLHHPNIAQVYDIGLDEGDYFFAMEYVHGEDLAHIAAAAEEQGVPISLDAALTLVAGLCAGLHYAHERTTAEGKPQQIVHRDVSPSNVLVSYDGAVKLVDFGIARVASQPGTTQGALKGKIAYMSPEQCKAHATLDRRSDIYSAGTLLYELTTGKLPFTGETEYQILNQIVNEDAPPPSRVVADYPPALEKIVLRALAREPAARFSTSLELQGALEDFAHDTRLRVSPLVLARLMGTLFPARLEEWDHAKTQGPSFVEQHVVSTLLESGKSADPSDPAIAAAQARRAAVEQAAERAQKEADDEPTAITHPPLVDLGGDFATNSLPIVSEAEKTLRDSPLPTTYPVLSVANAGVLVTPTHITVPVPVMQEQGDVGERVRVPRVRHTSPTTFVRAGMARTTRLIAIVSVLALAGGIAAFIALRGDDPVKPVPSGAPAESTIKLTPSAPQPSSAPLPAPQPSAAPQPAAPAAAPMAEASPGSAAPPKPATTKPASSKTKPAATKPKPRTEPKKPPGWNADSPFLPVRPK